MTIALLDTSAAIYFLDRPAGDARHDFVASRVRTAQHNGDDLILSPTTLAELLVAPIKAGDQRAEALVQVFANTLCRVVIADATTATVAAALRVEHGVRIPDAFILASAIEHTVDVVIGNDARWKSVRDVNYIYIDDNLNADV